ncbi:polycystin-1-like protein 1 [Rhinophrynus dorsalis]
MCKVHIVLHGEDGVSETRELHCPDKALFEKNSRHTFIMSIPDSLGPIWKIHIWHNNSGHSPRLYLSHIIIKDLQCGSSWFFLAESWLAVDEGDGKVERELTPIGHGLGFKKLFYCKFTEYLEDFHIWSSVYSRPSHSCFTRFQRITVCIVLLLGYICMNIVLIHWKGEEKKSIKDSGEDGFKATKDSQMHSVGGSPEAEVLEATTYDFLDKSVRQEERSRARPNHTLD